MSAWRTIYTHNFVSLNYKKKLSRILKTLSNKDLLYKKSYMQPHICISILQGIKCKQLISLIEKKSFNLPRICEKSFEESNIKPFKKNAEI